MAFLSLCLQVFERFAIAGIDIEDEACVTIRATRVGLAFREESFDVGVERYRRV